MTTRVTIAASCGNDEKVIITIIEDEAEDYVKELENGETTYIYVYDSRTVTVKEVLK